MDPTQGILRRKLSPSPLRIYRGKRNLIVLARSDQYRPCITTEYHHSLVRQLDSRTRRSKHESGKCQARSHSLVHIGLRVAAVLTIIETIGLCRSACSLDSNDMYEGWEG